MFAGCIRSKWRNHPIDLNESSNPQPDSQSAAFDSSRERKRHLVRAFRVDISLETLPIFRLSDSAESTVLSYSPETGGRWRVIPHPGDRLPGTFDQDVYIEILRRYHDAGSPADGVVCFTLHSFLRSMGRRADGRTYEQLRFSLARLERTVLESSFVYYDANAHESIDASFTLLSSVKIQRRRDIEKDQFALFPSISSAEPGEARVVIGPTMRHNLFAGHIVTLDIDSYLSLQSAVARRLYRLLSAVRAKGVAEQWRIGIVELSHILPLNQRYPSHLMRVLHPAHEMLITVGLLKGVSVIQAEEKCELIYDLGIKTSDQPFSPAGGKDLA